jgi:hypothetical protein
MQLTTEEQEAIRGWLAPAGIRPVEHRVEDCVACLAFLAGMRGEEAPPLRAQDGDLRRSRFPASSPPPQDGQTPVSAG